MEDFLNSALPAGQRPDIYLCIFPHLKEFLAIDLREGPSRPIVIDASQAFNQQFFSNVEGEFSRILREDGDFPFAHFINIPLRVEEIIREMTMVSILERLGVKAVEDGTPSVVVFLISGGALATQSEHLVQALKGILGELPEEAGTDSWREVLARMIARENAALQQVNKQQLSEALSGESPNLFTLWEQRN